jgi:RimJ/RimL family protein N-acetyltransferase
VATEIRLRDGTRALTWALLPEDRDELARRYDLLGPESKFERFLSAVPHLSPSMLTHLVDEADGVDHVALVLFLLEEDGTGTPAGVGHLIRYPDDPTTADVAVTVAEEHRGRGVATALLARLVDERPEGVTRILTSVAATNRPSLAMLRRLGPTTVSDHDDRLEVVVDLSPCPARS